MTKRQRPPRDSWIAIEAGQRVLMDVQAMQAESNRMARYGREVRGTLLSSAYEIEWILDQVLLGAFLPGQENPPTAQRTIFDDRLLKRSPLNLAYKIKLLSELRKTIPKLTELVPEELIEDLQAIRNYRNDFAHCPVALYPDGPEPIVKLKAVLVGSENSLELNDESVKKVLGLLSKTTTSLDSVLRSLNEGALGKPPNL